MLTVDQWLKKQHVLLWNCGIGRSCGDILNVCGREYHHFVWFCVEILLVCLLAWFGQFSMPEKSIVDSGFKRMSCLTPGNPFKLGNPFTPASDSSLDLSVNYYFSLQTRSHQRMNWIIFQLICLHTTRNFSNLLKILQIMIMVLTHYNIILKHFECCSVVNGWCYMK